MLLLQTMSIISCLAAVQAAPSSGPLEARITLPKANEYKSTDCSGSLNFGHHSGALKDVTMDGTSHSVYLAATAHDTWEAWSGNTGNGGGCTGTALGLVPHLQCVDLDKTYSQRIGCVRYHKQT